MSDRTIIVREIPEWLTEADLTIYFQSRKCSGGGDIAEIELARSKREGKVMFEDKKVAENVLSRPHIISGQQVTVTQEPIVKHYRMENQTEGFTVLVSGLSSQTTEDAIRNYLENNRRSRGGDVENINLHENEAMVTFSSSEDAERVLEKTDHILDGCALTISTPPIAAAKPTATITSGEPSEPIDSRVILVSRIASSTTKATVWNFFENKRRSGGGDVEEVELDEQFGTAKITFCEASDAERVLEKTDHILDGCALTISTPPIAAVQPTATITSGDSELIDSRVILVSGIASSTTKDTVLNFFENKRRSGGGDVEEVELDEQSGTAKITFCEASVACRVTEKEVLTLDGAQLTVKLQAVVRPIPMDPYRLHVSGLSDDTSKDGLMSYMEIASGDVEVTDILFGSFSNALVTFQDLVDVQRVLRKCGARPLEGCMLTIDQVPVCDRIQVTGIAARTTRDTVYYYFENVKNGGGEISTLEYQPNSTNAIISFKDPSDVDSVSKKSHIINGANVIVTPCYAFLGETSDVSPRKRHLMIEVEPSIITFILESFGEEFKNLMQENKLEFEWEPSRREATLKPNVKKIDKGQWDCCCKCAVDYIGQFVEDTILVKKPVWTKLKASASVLKANGVMIEFDDNQLEVTCTGKSQEVKVFIGKMSEIMHDIEKEIEIENSRVTRSMDDITEGSLQLMELADFAPTLEGQHKHLNVEVLHTEKEIKFTGPDETVKEGNVAVLKFLLKVKEEDVIIPKQILPILKANPGKTVIMDGFKRADIDAVVTFDEQGNNKVKITGTNRENANLAATTLQDLIAEVSVEINKDQAQLLQTQQWKAEQARLMQSQMIHIGHDLGSNKILVSGLKDPVEDAASRIGEFFETYTIVTKVLHLENGENSFLFSELRDEVKAIETNLAGHSVEIKSCEGRDDITVRGTEEGTEKAVKDVQTLLSSIQTEQVQLDKPGMEKAFNEAKGERVIKIIELQHNCIIKRCSAVGTPRIKPVVPFATKPMSTELVGSYATPEGKTISVYRGDLTKHQADILVNAANGDLQHIGGVAIALVKAGGAQIQDECDRYVAENGPLLEGDVVVLGGHNLPCKRLIHAVGPKWSFNETRDKEMGKTTGAEKLLAWAAKQCLEKSKDYASIALPAISTGVFGFPVDICVKTLIETVLEFSENNLNTKLNQIHFVDNNERVVQAFIEEMKAKFGSQALIFPAGSSSSVFGNQSSTTDNTTFTTNMSSRQNSPMDKKQTTSESVSSLPSSEPNSFITAEGLKISVIIGDLSKQQVHVIVNTGSSDLNLNQNACAKSLSDAAGPGLQQECTAGLQARGGLLSHGDMLVTGGHNLQCKKVFHVIAGGWNGGQGEQTLRVLLRKCFSESDRAGLSSISIPAIGTGNLHFPRDVVAKACFEEADKFRKQNPQTSLDEVRFVVYSKDHPTVQAFQQELQSRQSSTAPGKKARRGSSRLLKSKVQDGSNTNEDVSIRDLTASYTEVQIGPITLQVGVGDITDETTDAIATPSNTDLQLNVGAGVGSSIARSAGPSVLKECKKLGKQKPGKVVSTGAGNLKSTKIYHLVVPQTNNTKDLVDIVLECLKMAEAQGIRSIAFPAIGTGVFGIKPKDAAHALLKAFASFAQQQQPSTLKYIRIVVYKADMLQEFFTAIDELSKSGSSSGFTGTIKWLANEALHKLGLSTSKTAVNISQPKLKNKTCLKVYAGNNKDLKDAISAIKETARENVRTTTIENSVIERLPKEQQEKISSLQEQYDISIEQQLPINRIVIRGDLVDISAASTSINKLLTKFTEEQHTREKAEMVLENVQWSVNVEEDWSSYDCDLNHKIEQAFKSGLKFIPITTKDDQDKVTKYRLSFADMTETNLETKERLQISRKEKGKGVTLPPHWDPQPPDSNGKEKVVHLVQLDPEQQEYKQVSDGFKKTAGQNIVKVERVQNPQLYGAYAAFKDKMEGRKGSNEQHVYHGTRPDTCDLINHLGFNRSHCGRNATMYGNGVYFARDASYSARSQYSPVDQATGQRFMYLASILAGEYTTGTQGMIVPPPKDPTDPTVTYDTVVDTPSNPGIYVVFHDTKCYPEYLITFK